MELQIMTPLAPTPTRAKANLSGGVIVVLWTLNLLTWQPHYEERGGGVIGCEGSVITMTLLWLDYLV